jgi:hypothetical protein
MVLPPNNILNSTSLLPHPWALAKGNENKLMIANMTISASIIFLVVMVFIFLNLFYLIKVRNKIGEICFLILCLNY